MANKIRFRPVASTVGEKTLIQTRSSVFINDREISKVSAEILPHTIEIRGDKSAKLHTKYLKKISPRSTSTGMVTGSKTRKKEG